MAHKLPKRGQRAATNHKKAKKSKAMKSTRRYKRK